MARFIVGKPCDLKNIAPDKRICIISGCNNIAITTGQIGYGIGYCSNCFTRCREEFLACGVCNNDTSEWRKDNVNTCPKHYNFTLRECKNPKCEYKRFYRHKNCFRINQFRHLPDEYSINGNDYCDMCLPEITELNKSLFAAQKKELDKDYHLSTKTIATKVEDEQQNDEDDISEDYYPNLVVEVEHTIVVKVKETYKLPRSVKEDAWSDKATGSLKLFCLPKSLQKYKGNVIPEEIISAQRASAAYVKRVDEITLDN
jgi:hypothetical protein